jgi:hypothetical protein
MNRIVLKIKLLSEKSLELTLVYVDERLLTQGVNMVYFNNNDYEFILYSKNKLKIGDTFLRLPSKEHYESNMKIEFTFISENKMYIWLKDLHKTLIECNHNFTPFKKDPQYHNRLKKVILNGEYWII